MKQAMKARKAHVQEEIKQLRKEHRAAVKEKLVSTAKRLEKRIEQLEKEKNRYAASVQPVRFANGFVLDGALLKRFIKKVPANLQPFARFDGKTNVEICYKGGKLCLLDLALFYQGLDLPKGEDLLEELGIPLS